jgi:gamma-glutamylcyclotransferase (GGCT)/AIG2-like uncharacterized protein YtfP
MTAPKHTTKDEHGREEGGEPDGGGGATGAGHAAGAGPVLRLAVYGTLRRGGPNHDRYMRGYRSVEAITLRGRLRRLTATIPILDVPDADIAAVGSADPLADMRLAERLQREDEEAPRPAPAGTWDEIPAELFTFDDPATRVPPLDRLEGFRPGGRSLYRRVLLGQPWGCWVYVAGEDARG